MNYEQYMDELTQLWSQFLGIQLDTDQVWAMINISRVVDQKSYVLNALGMNPDIEEPQPQTKAPRNNYKVSVKRIEHWEEAEYVYSLGEDGFAVPLYKALSVTLEKHEEEKVEITFDRFSSFQKFKEFLNYATRDFSDITIELVNSLNFRVETEEEYHETLSHLNKILEVSPL